MSGIPRHPRGHSTRAVVVGSADQFSSLVIAKSKKFVQRHPVISLTWVLGLLISIMATGFTPSPEAVEKYEAKVSLLNVDGLAEAEEELVYWEDAYQRSRGVLWGCNADCMRKKQEYGARRRILESLNRDYQRKLAEAKSELGVFSQDAVEETKGLFWEKVAGGKQFAKRATMWNAMFLGLGVASRRDEGIVTILVRLAFRILTNLTIGLVMAVLGFLFSIWQVISSYNPDPLTSMAFFGMAAIAALSILITWLVGLAAIGVGGFYTFAKVLETAQIEAARQQGHANDYTQHPQQWSYPHQGQNVRQRRQTPAYNQAPDQYSTRSTASWDHLD